MFFTTIIVIGFSVFMSGCCGENSKKTHRHREHTVDNRFDFLVGTWITDGEYCFDELLLVINKKNGEYSYFFKTSEAEQVGPLEIISEGDDTYINLLDVKWSEYRGAIPEDKDVNEVAIQEDVYGLDLQYDNEMNKLLLQNRGNNMNYYIKIAEVECNYAALRKVSE